MDITQAIVDDFLERYAAFSDAVLYSASDITFALEDADQETGPRWGGYRSGPFSLKARGMFAYAAHRLSMDRLASRATSNGMAPPAPATVASKGVGDESVSYAVAAPEASKSEGWGDLNTTIYGKEFLRLRRRAGMGAVTTGSVRL